MNMNALTLADIRKLINALTNALTNHNTPETPPSLGSEMLGKYVIVRSRNEGINAGIVAELDSSGIVLKKARRIWYHKPADSSMSWYEGVAVSGLSEDSKISAEVLSKTIMEDYSITECTDIAEESIRRHESYEQS